MVESESWSPAWCFDKSLQGTSQVNKPITHKEKPAETKVSFLFYALFYTKFTVKPVLSKHLWDK